MENVFFLPEWLSSRPPPASRQTECEAQVPSLLLIRGRPWQTWSSGELGEGGEPADRSEGPSACRPLAPPPAPFHGQGGGRGGHCAPPRPWRPACLTLVQPRGSAALSLGLAPLTRGTRGRRSQGLWALGGEQVPLDARCGPQVLSSSQSSLSPIRRGSNLKSLCSLLPQGPSSRDSWGPARGSQPTTITTCGGA